MRCSCGCGGGGHLLLLWRCASLQAGLQACPAQEPSPCLPSLTAPCLPACLPAHLQVAMTRLNVRIRQKLFYSLMAQARGSSSMAWGRRLARGCCSC